MSTLAPTLPPITVSLRILPTAVVIPLPVLTVTATLGPASVLSGPTPALVQPANGETVPDPYTVFIVGLTNNNPDSNYTLNIQFDDNNIFSSPVTLTVPVLGALQGIQVAHPNQPLPAHGFWRAQMYLTGDTTSNIWTAPAEFTVDTAAGQSTATVSFTTDTGTPDIHVWFTDPAAIVGEQVTVYGQGFPATGTLLFGGLPTPVDSWTLVPAAANPTGTIAPGQVDPEHYEITFTVPDVDESDGGGLLEVTA